MQRTFATFNIANDSFDYAQRKELLVAAFAALRADVIALQEVRLVGDRQDDMLMAAAPTHRYRSFAARYTGKWHEYGIATLVDVDAGEVLAHEVLELAEGRIAQRILFALPEMKTVWFANTHLHHRHDEPEVRLAQVRHILEWLADAPRADATIVAGDFNATPDEPAYGAMSETFRSAYRAVHGAEPPATRTTEPGCHDYIWLAGAATATASSLAANESSGANPARFASDHFALTAAITF